MFYVMGSGLVATEQDVEINPMSNAHRQPTQNTELIIAVYKKKQCQRALCCRSETIDSLFQRCKSTGSDFQLSPRLSQKVTYENR